MLMCIFADALSPNIVAQLHTFIWDWAAPILRTSPELKQHLDLQK